VSRFPNCVTTLDLLIGKTDAAEKLNQQLLDSHFIGFGTLNLENGVENLDSQQQVQCLQWATQNTLTTMPSACSQHSSPMAIAPRSTYLSRGHGSR
jgi:hypothetical protein